MTSKKARGRPSSELTEVLYVRCGPRLLELLDDEVERWRQAEPGWRVSRADVARTILYEALGDDTDE